jgi:5-methyltetrahydropteroyltriglutamate--homocysteine methyltransferase
VESVRWASERVSLDRVYVNPSCGLEYLPRDRAYQKLVRLVEGVKRAKEVLA